MSSEDPMKFAIKPDDFLKAFFDELKIAPFHQQDLEELCFLWGEWIHLKKTKKSLFLPWPEDFSSSLFREMLSSLGFPWHQLSPKNPTQVFGVDQKWRLHLTIPPLSTNYLLHLRFYHFNSEIPKKDYALFFNDVSLGKKNIK